MAAGIAGFASIVIAFASAAAPKLRGAGPADPFVDFGPLSWFAVTLDIINTVVVVYYVWRIWTRREVRAARGAVGAGGAGA